MEINLSVAQSLFLIACTLMGIVGIYLVREEL